MEIFLNIDTNRLRFLLFRIWAREVVLIGFVLLWLGTTLFALYRIEPLLFIFCALLFFLYPRENRLHINRSDYALEELSSSERFRIYRMFLKMGFAPPRVSKVIPGTHFWAAAGHRKLVRNIYVTPEVLREKNEILFPVLGHEMAHLRCLDHPFILLVRSLWCLSSSASILLVCWIISQLLSAVLFSKGGVIVFLPLLWIQFLAVPAVVFCMRLLTETLYVELWKICETRANILSIVYTKVPYCLFSHSRWIGAQFPYGGYGKRCFDYLCELYPPG